MTHVFMVLPILATWGCTYTKTSAVPTSPGQQAPWGGNVTISATRMPSDAKELGLVQAAGSGTIEDLIPAFVKQVADLGGNYGYIDTITSKFEMKTSTQPYSYSCGSAQMPRTCHGVRTVTHEVRTTQVVGRAFFLEGKP